MRKIFSFLIAVVIFFGSFTPAYAQQQKLRVYYAGAEGAVLSALKLGKQFVLVSDPGQADVLVLNGAIPPGAAESYHAGAGLLLILGPGLQAGETSALLGMPVDLSRQENAISLDNAPGASGGMLADVLWNSSPQVRERYAVSGVGSPAQPLVSGYDNHEWVLWSLPTSQGRGETYVFNAFLEGSNPQIQEWAYFNYLVYNLVTRAGGHAPLSFAAYPASPVPHAAERNGLILLMTSLLVTAGLAFVVVRRYSRAHPELLDALVTGQAAYAANQASTEWEEVGFHRPLGGFLLALMMGLVLFIPLIIYQSLILPVYILPSAQALGIWGRVTQFFNLLWTFFDMGTGLAFIKFFSEYRVNDPRKAIQYGQVFVWWQALSGGFPGGPGCVDLQPVSTANRLRPVCLERHHSHVYPDPRVLRSDEECFTRLAALGLRHRPGNRLQPDFSHAHPTGHGTDDGSLGAQQPGLRTRNGRPARHGSRRLRDRSTDFHIGPLAVPPAGL